MKREVHVFEEAIDIWKAMAERWKPIMLDAVRQRGICTVALSGGKTPLGLYCYLGRKSDLPWEETAIFQVDERFVPSDSEESNIRGIELSLLLRAGVPTQNVYPIDTSLGSAAEAADGYEKVLEGFFGGHTEGTGGFDIILLGIGGDGHTASLFPGDDLLLEKRRRVSAVSPASAPHDRVTLTLPVINKARHIFFLVTGDGKRDALVRVMGGKDESLPASLVQPAGGEVVFFLDRPASDGTVGDFHGRGKV